MFRCFEKTRLSIILSFMTLRIIPKLKKKKKKKWYLMAYMHEVATHFSSKLKYQTFLLSSSRRVLAVTYCVDSPSTTKHIHCS